MNGQAFSFLAGSRFKKMWLYMAANIEEVTHAYVRKLRRDSTKLKPHMHKDTQETNAAQKHTHPLFLESIAISDKAVLS